MARSSNEIAAELSEADRTIALEKMASIEKKIQQRSKLDELIADSLLRVLKSPLGKSLQQRIKEIANND
jgi:hypothetical protein